MGGVGLWPGGVCVRVSGPCPGAELGPVVSDTGLGPPSPTSCSVYFVPNFSQLRVAWKTLVQFPLQVHRRERPKAKAALSIAIQQVQKPGDCDEASVRPGIWLLLI